MVTSDVKLDVEAFPAFRELLVDCQDRDPHPVVDGLTLKPFLDCREPEASQVFTMTWMIWMPMLPMLDLSQLIADRSLSRPCGERDLGLVQNLPVFVRHVEAAYIASNWID